MKWMEFQSSAFILKNNNYTVTFQILNFVQYFKIVVYFYFHSFKCMYIDFKVFYERFKKIKSTLWNKMNFENYKNKKLHTVVFFLN